MTKDYSYLEGKEFTFHNGTEEIAAKVLYADYHIGITCVNLYDSDDYLICLKGPLAPNTGNTLPKKVHQALWFSLVNRIKHGYVDSGKLLQVYRGYTSVVGNTMPSSESCAFGQ